MSAIIECSLTTLLQYVLRQCHAHPSTASPAAGDSAPTGGGNGGALHYGYLPLAEVLAALRNKRPMLHVVITGRNASPESIALADLVSEMKVVKHPYRAGVRAQKDVEF
jgi:hypothetical protein